MANNKIYGLGLIFLVIILSFPLALAEQLKVTSEHPFLVNGSWIPAKQLSVGDELKTSDGKTAKITGMRFVPDKTTVYNLEDAFYHNYVLSDGLIVHNSHAPVFGTGDIVTKYGEITVKNLRTPEGIKGAADHKFEDFQREAKAEMAKGIPWEQIDKGAESRYLYGQEFIEKVDINALSEAARNNQAFFVQVSDAKGTVTGAIFPSELSEMVARSKGISSNKVKEDGWYSTSGTPSSDSQVIVHVLLTRWAAKQGITLVMLAEDRLVEAYSKPFGAVYLDISKTRIDNAKSCAIKDITDEIRYPRISFESGVVDGKQVSAPITNNVLLLDPVKGLEQRGAILFQRKADRAMGEP